MKRILYLALSLICLLSTNSFATKWKTIRIANHAAIIDALTSVKSSSESVRGLVDDKWPPAAKAQMALLYTRAKNASDKLISGYEVIIPQWRYAQKNGLDVTKQLQDLQAADNAMVTYFENTYLKYNGGAALSITTELIDLVFDTGKKIYEFVKGIDEKTQALYKSQVEDQRIKVEFNGVKSGEDHIISKTDTAQKKGEQKPAKTQQTVKPKTN